MIEEGAGISDGSTIIHHRSIIVIIITGIRAMVAAAVEAIVEDVITTVTIITITIDHHRQCHHNTDRAGLLIKVANDPIEKEEVDLIITEEGTVTIF